MSRLTLSLLALTLLATSAFASDYPFQPVPFVDVRLTGGFWMQRQETNRDVTIPFGLKQCEESGRLHNFDLAAEVMHRRASGEPHFQIKPPTQFPFDDTDAYKAIEAASYELSTQYDAKLDHTLDDWIRRIAAAQEPDGYLYTFRTMHPDSPGHPWVGQNRWDNDPILSHELYDCGHLYEAGYAHFRATGKRTLLNVCLKNANLLWHDFGDRKRRLAPGHEVVEMGLVKLYRATGDSRYLTLAQIFLDARGPGGPAYDQQQLLVVDQTKAVGHAVRANYLYSGMADVAALTGDTRYETAATRIWDNVAETKLYLTGGVGAHADGERYGDDYELPNNAYNETCAAVAMMMWCHRMFLLTGESRYMDVFERTAYNGFISGVSLSGDRFFYPNPLVYDGKSKNNAGYAGRAPWFGCACCPPNLMRTLASLTGYFYAVQNIALYVNLYGQSVGKTTVQGTPVEITQTTDYPWSGHVTLTVNPASRALFVLKLRIPCWAEGRPVPTDLYTYEHPASDWSISVNGHRIQAPMVKGYAAVVRQWQPGDQVTLDFAMPVEGVHSNSKVAADAGRVAFERGPVVYCVEQLKGDRPIDELQIPPDASVRPVKGPTNLDGVTELEIQNVKDRSFPSEPARTITAIPYFAWDNRGLVPMAVWLPEAGR
ncbi:MAG TPA: beta-L-arabinofuranosidase domain-containing protein [Opitutaceae bacterium]